MKQHPFRLVAINGKNYVSFSDSKGGHTLIPEKEYLPLKTITTDVPATFDVIIEQIAKQEGMLKKDVLTCLLYESLVNHHYLAKGEN